MATHYYGINAGKNLDAALVSSATTGYGLEVVVDDSKLTTKDQVITALENLKLFILQTNYMPF